MVLEINWPQALAWRMARHGLDPVGRPSVEDVVERLCGVQAQVASSAELAIRVRRQRSAAGDVARSLSDGRLIKTWAMRGTLHLLRPETGGAFLSLIAAGRPWERPAWVKYFGLTPAVMEALREAVQEVLVGGATLTREELIAAIVPRHGLGHVGDAIRSGWGTILKPLAWQGDLCFGPSQGTHVTFRRPETASDRWAGVPSPEEAAPIAIGAYFSTYGPTTVASFAAWLSGGYFGKGRLRAWFEQVASQLVEVSVGGDRAFVLSEDVDSLAATAPTREVRLLPGFDQYVLGPGTSDGRVLAPGRRAAVSRQSGWIAPVVVSRGVIAGTWELGGEEVRVDWFAEAGRVPKRRLGAEVERLGSIVGRPLRLVVGVAASAV